MARGGKRPVTQRRTSARERALPTVDRKIHFYRLNAGITSAGQPLVIDITQYLQRISDLQFTVPGRYLEFEQDMFSCCWVDRNQAHHRIRFSTIRRTGLPQVERGGLLSPLTIPNNSGLSEQIHVVFFPDGLVGSDFNFYGPRMNRLATYLDERAGLNPTVSFDPLIRQDILRELNRLQDISLLQMRIRAPYAEIVAQADRNLGDAFRAAARATNADDLEIVVRMRPRSSASLAGGIGRAIRTLIRRGDTRTEMTQFKVKGHNNAGAIEMIDLLNDELISTKQIRRETGRGRALDSSSAYEAIEESYRELRQDLEAAAALTE